MWAHPPFLAEVTSWIQELLITGRVELGKEKTPEELDAIWKSRIAEEQAKIQADYLRENASARGASIAQSTIAHYQQLFYSVIKSYPCLFYKKKYFTFDFKSFKNRQCFY